MIFKCKTLRVRAYHLYINLPRKCLFSAYVRECSGYGVSTVYWVRTEKKKRYSRSDGEKSYGEKLRRIRASLGGCSGVWGGGNSIL